LTFRWLTGHFALHVMVEDSLEESEKLVCIAYATGKWSGTLQWNSDSFWVCPHVLGTKLAVYPTVQVHHFLKGLFCLFYSVVFVTGLRIESVVRRVNGGTASPVASSKRFLKAGELPPGAMACASFNHSYAGCHASSGQVTHVVLLLNCFKCTSEKRSELQLYKGSNWQDGRFCEPDKSDTETIGGSHGFYFYHWRIEFSVDSYWIGWCP
jgi:hypothetical protein